MNFVTFNFSQWFDSADLVHLFIFRACLERGVPDKDIVICKTRRALEKVQSN